MDLKCTNVCLFVSIAGLVSDLPPGKTVLERKPGRGERVVLPFAHSPSSKEKPVQAQGDPVAALLSPSPPQSELSETHCSWAQEGKIRGQQCPCLHW